MKQDEKKRRVAIGMSGGVDSSVAAALLKEQGCDVTGVYLTCWSGPGCRSEEDRKDALDITLQLGIPFEHLDFQKEYKEKVYEYMVREYQAGRTPNPDVVCNKEIKFGLFFNWAMKSGFDFVATGHYAQTDGTHLLRSKDEHKDQTYFLYELKGEQLPHILFPIGHLTKPEVRKEAEKRKLLSAEKPDSQGVCFIGEVPMRKFLQERINPQNGPVMIKRNDKEIVLGSHRGVWFSTIGQRTGFTLAGDGLRAAGFEPANLPPLYVTEKDTERNILYIGTEEQLHQDLVTITDLHLITDTELPANGLMVRIRHTGELIPITGYKARDKECTLTLMKPVRGVAPGQAAVLYCGQECLGGGIICQGSKN